MGRTQLVLASIALAAAGCLAVLVALREPAAPPLPDVGAPPAPERSGTPVNDVREPAPHGSPPDLLAENVRSAEEAEQAVRDALLAAARDERLPLAARLDLYRDAIATAREQLPAAPIWGYPGMLAELFLREPAVQRELAALSPPARRGELAHIRRELGFDAAAIERMAARDERREARWQNGAAYMQERARIASTFTGAALETELHGLREAFFAHEAGTIEAEEREGFFRFQRPRIYGRN